MTNCYYLLLYAIYIDDYLDIQFGACDHLIRQLRIFFNNNSNNTTATDTSALDKDILVSIKAAFQTNMSQTYDMLCTYYSDWPAGLFILFYFIQLHIL